MALQVWLPLNGDLRNLGAANINFKSGKPSFSDDGKIGKCMSTGDAIFNLPETLFDSISETNTFSFACWCKDKKGSGKNRAFWLGDGNKRIRGYYENRVADNLNWAYATVGQDVPINIDVLDGEWHHIVFVSDGVTKKLTVYIDGIFQNEIIQDYTMSLGGTKTLSLRTTDKKLNDFRLYDHCLSALEVKEISQALILHYKLDNSSILNYSEIGNLIPNYKEMGLGAANVTTGTWRTAGTNNMTRTRVQITDSPIGECYCFQNSGIQTANDGSCYGIDNTTYFEPNTEYRISMFARITAGTEGYAGFHIYNISEELGGSHTKIDKNYRVTSLNSNGAWTYCWYHIKTNSSITRNIYIGITTGETSVTTQMCLVRIDKWNNGMDNSIVIDSSGYGNDGIVVGNLNNNIEETVGRYQNTTYSKDGRTNYIVTPSLNFNSNAVTLNIWFKSNNKTPTNDYHMVIDSNAHRQWYEMCVNKNGYLRGGLFVNGTRYADNGTSTSILNGNWHMLTMTYDGNIIKRYVDGIMEKSTTVTKTSGLSSPTAITLFRDGPNATYACQETSLNDFRIYTTALDEKAIKKLYNTPTEIDKNHNYHTMELDEIANDISVKKTGKTKAKVFTETTNNNTFFKNGTVNGHFIIEK